MYCISKKSAVFIVMMLLLISKHNNAQYLSGEKLISISPNSKMVLLVKDDTIIIEEIGTRKNIYTKKENFFKDYEQPGFDHHLLKFISNEEILMCYESKNERYLCIKNLYTNNQKKILITEPESYKIEAIDVSSVNHDIYIFFVSGGSIDDGSKKGKIKIAKYSDSEEKMIQLKIMNFPLPVPSIMMDITYFNEDTLFLNYDGELAFADLKNKSIKYIFDYRGSKISVGESKIQILRRSNNLLFSYEDTVIALYDLKSNTLRKIETLQDCILPILALNEDFFFCCRRTYPSFYRLINSEILFK